ncbi:transmembrane protein, putative (macronuclear) [Tetrahymena thermophila SB210]|uniref:Transmembrane protein, putative n=1 Tax=Tetrahymena thermophila (strain SB210) TaxID=312017 RepID=W7XFT4_TETTS|nr:transmembrane protein, putative [Tetrahymena thermophila SB210]EWS71684.1 transmembrane protein, putative [Tetrahymena thermophila SB210]|eukprot:XP_012655795.1 transmembrane protein, putative [Tetrahymena thermophila SB210]
MYSNNNFQFDCQITFLKCQLLCNNSIVISWYQFILLTHKYIYQRGMKMFTTLVVKHLLLQGLIESLTLRRQQSRKLQQLLKIYCLFYKIINIYKSFKKSHKFQNELLQFMIKYFIYHKQLINFIFGEFKNFQISKQTKKEIIIKFQNKKLFYLIQHPSFPI